MSGYDVYYRPEVREDLDDVPGNMESRIQRTIEERLMTHPHQYGQRLRQSLHNHWRLRTGDYRIVYEIDREEESVIIWAILHRKDVYGEVEKRRED